MSFQAYIDKIKANTGKSPDDFKKLVEQKRFHAKRTTCKNHKSNRNHQLA